MPSSYTTRRPSTRKAVTDFVLFDLIAGWYLPEVGYSLAYLFRLLNLKTQKLTDMCHTRLSYLLDFLPSDAISALTLTTL